MNLELIDKAIFAGNVQGVVVHAKNIVLGSYYWGNQTISDGSDTYL